MAKGSKRARHLAIPTIVAVVVLAAAAAQVTQAPSGPQAQASIQDRAGLLEENHERAADTRGRMAKMQNFPERTGVADSEPVTHIAGRTWEGSSKFGNGNDWEPDIAADPSSDFVYWTTTRYGDKACNNCPNGALVYRVSPDNGETWGPVGYLCRCKGAVWQADPQVEVSDDGTVYVTILQQWDTYLRVSTDHGATWGPLVNIAPDFKPTDYYNWTDHGFLTVSPDGSDVYVAFSHGGSLVSASHDGGATFEDPVKTNVPGMNEYYYHYKGVVNGDEAWIAAVAGTSSPYYAGLIKYYSLHTLDGGMTWHQDLVATVKQQPSCKTPWNPLCHTDHFGGLSGLDRSPDGTLVYAYAGATVPANGQQVYVSRSTDGGETWSAGMAVSPEKRYKRRVIAAFPTIISGGVDDFRLTYMDDRRGLRRWNTWYTESDDGGLTWSPDERTSDAAGGAPYQHPNGYDADYGDYGGIAVLSDGRTIATWGAGISYWGPGGTWVNIQEA